MGNSLNQDLHGKTVRLRPETHSLEWRQPEHLLFRVDGGFGASADLRGTALIGEYLFDGERARVEGFDVEAIVEDPTTPDNDEKKEH